MISNLAASVRARLLNLARKDGADFGLMLNRYGRERLLYRISQSAQKERFVLKGATLFESWTGKSYRPTRDVDLLGFGASNVPDLVRTFQEICTVRVQDDGLIFLPQSVRGEEIREPQDYPGVRLKLLAMLESADRIWRCGES